MIRDPHDLQRYTAHERANHWLVAMCFVLLALSGLALFQPLFWPLAGLFGGGVWARILHPYVGIVMSVTLAGLALRFYPLNVMTTTDWQWLKRSREMMAGDDHNMPEQGKYNGGQKLLFWALLAGTALQFVSGIVLWRAYFGFPVELVRLAAVLHAAAAATLIALVMVHVYAAIWVKGTVRAMLYGTVTRAWARQHHRAWYRQIVGK